MEVTQERVNLKIEQEKLSNVSRGVEEKVRWKILEEIMAEDFPHLAEGVNNDSGSSVDTQSKPAELCAQARPSRGAGH